MAWIPQPSSVKPKDRNACRYSMRRLAETEADELSREVFV
jgi:hypothetical protein